MSTTTDPTPIWYQVFAPRPDARLRLYTLAGAGSGASLFRPWAARLPDWIELRAVRLPGRQARHREPSFEDCDTSATELAGWLSAEREPYALFGHSMGAMLAYRATRVLHAAGARLPLLLGAASWPVQGAKSDRMPDPAAPDEEFVASMRAMGSAVGELLDDPDMRALTLPVLRSDFRLCRSYVFRDEGPFPVPVAVYGGDTDEITPPGAIAVWSDHADTVGAPRLFPGGHFFLLEEVAALTEAVVRDLTAVMADARADVAP